MKVLMINSVCGIRSTGRICVDIAEELEKQGHEVKIAYGREAYVPEQYKKYAVRIGNNWDVRLHALKARLFDASGFGSKQATKRFIEWVKEYDPDIIHLHNIHGYYINIKILFDYLTTCNKKIIWTLHDCWAFTGHSGTCDAKDCERWKECCHDCPMRKEYPRAYIDRSKQNWIKKKEIITAVSKMKIVTPSYWLEGLVKESFLSKYEVQTIHNGIDLNQFYPLENDFKRFYGIEDKIMVLGVANSWTRDKGFEDFIELSKKLDEEYRIVLVGLDDDQLKIIPNSIIGIKKTNSIKELAQIYSAADVFVNMTYCDTYPTVNLEAQACGTPVITYETGRSKESVFANKSIVKRGAVDEVLCKITEKSYLDKESNNICITNKKMINRVSALKNYLCIYDDSNKVGGGFFFTRNKYNLERKMVILAVASVWEERKGLADIIELFNLLKKENLDKKYQIIVVGLNKKQLLATPEGIIGLERTNNLDELRELYSVSDIFINPTKQDNYPTVNLESISCGTPVITYNTGGSPESALLYGLVVNSNAKSIYSSMIDETILNIKKREETVSNDESVKRYRRLMEND